MIHGILDLFGPAAGGAAILVVLAIGLLSLLSRIERTKGLVASGFRWVFGPVVRDTVHQQAENHLDETLEDRISEAAKRHLDQALPHAVSAEVDSRMEEHDAKKEAELEELLQQEKRERREREDRWDAVREAILHSVAQNACEANSLSLSDKPFSEEPGFSAATWRRSEGDFMEMCKDGILLTKVPSFFDNVTELGELRRNLPIMRTPHQPENFQRDEERVRNKAHRVARQGGLILETLQPEEIERHAKVLGVPNFDHLTERTA